MVPTELRFVRELILFNELPESVPLNVAAEMVPFAEIAPVEEMLPVDSVPLILTFCALVPVVMHNIPTRQSARERKQVRLTEASGNGGLPFILLG
jgi:hypothetical protein